MITVAVIGAGTMGIGIAHTFAQNKNSKYEPYPLLLQMVQDVKLGVKSGKGFYDHSQNKKAEKKSKQFA
jgi:3-hydroxyacyl-CoA dehydrogenase